VHELDLNKPNSLIN